MSETFDPAPFDKYADKPNEAAEANRDSHENLKAGLVGTFPASDPVSAGQPSSGPVRKNKLSLQDWMTSIFKQ